MRKHCLSFPHATENVQWVSNLVFKVGGKMFAVASLEPGEHAFSFKCTPDKYAELVERPGIVPAPYLARANWVAFECDDALPRTETKSCYACRTILFSRNFRGRSGPDWAEM